MSRPRILFVAMQASPHAARWVSMIADQGWDLHIFPMNSDPIVAPFRNIAMHRPWIGSRATTAKAYLKDLSAGVFGEEHKLLLPEHENILEKAIFPIAIPDRAARYLNRIKTSLGVSDYQPPLAYGPRMLARLIKRLKPDLIHSMEFQHCGYNVLRARELIGAKRFPKWLATNWGSDIYLYRHDPVHAKQIAALLKAVDYYNCECHRDLEIARELGLTAPSLPIRPNSGGFNIPEMQALRTVKLPSKRRLMMVKGYQHFAGRALTALDAIARTADVLKDFKIIVFSPSPEITSRVDELRGMSLDIEIMPYATHARMLQLFSEARLYLGVSISDAISTSMLEALALGAFPIQTNTSCCQEWIEDGTTGFSIPPDDVPLIASRIREAATNDRLVDSAAKLNWKTTTERLDSSILQRSVIEDYQRILTI